MFLKAIFKLFPHNCIFCREIIKNFKISPICESCFNSLELWGKSCIKCGKKLQDYGVCGECMKEKKEFHFLFHIYSYEGKAKEMINLYKFKGLWYLAESFSLKIYETLKNFGEEFENAPLTFVPAHPYRILSRNYNPVEYLTKDYCKRYNKIFFPSLKKIKLKKPQTNLKKEEREENVKGTFKVIKKDLPEKIIIIDDIYTTGATLLECARILKRSGVEKIAGITLARA